MHRVLYSTPGSPPCRAVLMVKEILGLNFEIKEVKPLSGETRLPEFLAKNPIHSIPLLEDGDFILADSHAIITYLVSKYGAEQRAILYPSDLRIRATIDQRLFFDTSFLFPRFRSALVALVTKKLKAVPSESVQEIEDAYGYLEKYLEQSAFLATDHITLADISCIATVSSLNSMVPIDSKYERVHQWREKMRQQDWYQKGNGEGLAVIDGFLKSILQQDA